MGTNHEQHPWWQRGVIYQIYPRSFQDGSGDGIGDLAGITSRLDHLVWLGVDAVWLSPIFSSPMEDGGYDVADYVAVDPVFGSLDDADALIAAAHERDLRVILDFVPNHTSHRHPWFEESRRGPDSARRDWYLWRPPAAGGGPPNNWRSVTNDGAPGSAWVFDDASGEYFLATFSSAQPDLNWSNPAVRDALHDVLRFWLERGVDGFRIDMVGFLGKDPEFRDEPAPTADDYNYLRDGRHHVNRPETLGYLKEMRAVVDSHPDRVLIGEMSYYSPIESLVAFTTDAGVDLPTNFSLITLPFAPEHIAEHIDAYDAAVLAGGAWPNYCVGNHDMPRVSGHGPQRARLALLLLLTLRGTPFFYYGDEIGMANVEVPPEQRDDRWAVPQHGMTRDSVRTPMQWDPTPNAGFCPPDVAPWLPVADDYEQINVAIQRADETSLLHLTRRVLALRRSLPALSIGGYRRLVGGPPGCLAYVREHDGRDVAVVLNFDERTATIDLGVDTSHLLLDTGAASSVTGGVVEVPATAGVVVELA